jgi:hypothetical protein
MIEEKVIKNKYNYQHFRSRNGDEIFALDGKFHSWDHPAWTMPDGTKRYFLNGFEKTKDEWKEAKRELKGVPPTKNPAYDSSM